jgi:protein-tyrosine phosphatase
MKAILFLCTGNYYRSRFAELLFNALAERAGLGWRADSAGLAVNSGNVGPISQNTMCELAQRHIAVEAPQRFPRQVQEPDLLGADRVIALNESEHRRMLAEQFPGWAERAAYWHIPDLDRSPASEGLAAAERQVERLIRELRHPA